MVRPSRIARKARRAHKRQQENFQKHNLPICQGCDLCSTMKAQEVRRASRDSDIPCGQRQEHKQSLLSRIRQGLKNKFFKGVVFISPRHLALAEAEKEVGSCVEQSRSVYWTDGSRLKTSCCGIGIAYCSSTNTWTERSWRLRGSVKPHVLEVYAIAKALEISWENCRNMVDEHRPSSVCIYSDCLGALEYLDRSRRTLAGIKRFPYGEGLVGPGIIAAE
jgi:hypothetical protein